MATAKAVRNGHSDDENDSNWALLIMSNGRYRQMVQRAETTVQWLQANKPIAKVEKRRQRPASVEAVARSAGTRFRRLWRRQLMRYGTGERVHGASKAHGSLRRPLVDDLESPICTDCLRALSRRRPRRNARRTVRTLDSFQIMPAQWFFCLRGSGAVAPSAPAMRPVSPVAHVD
jgi:hypothetical protein